MNIILGPYRLKLTRSTTMVYLCLMILLVSLGNWQLSRSEEKAALLAQQEQSRSEPSVQLDLRKTNALDTMRYRSVEIQGRFDADHQFLIDNQIRHGKPGYFVMTPLITEHSEQAVLVNRGWIGLNEDRSKLPDVSIRHRQVVIKGRINKFPAVGLKLPKAEIPTDSWPAVVQVVDSRVLSDKLGYPLVDFQIEMNSESEPGYLREWTVTTTIPPEKHVAYAVQWFGLAFALTVLFFWYSCKTE